MGTGTFQLNLNTTLYVKLGDVYLDGCVLVTGAQEILFKIKTSFNTALKSASNPLSNNLFRPLN